ncbi:MAG: DNA repair protein RecO [Proteobacteria bacterium]|nr:DNA repair protein RecO [Pseudomonadota bacterium]
MLDWTDDGILLSLRPHGEGAAIVAVFTRAHGRHLGLVRGGGGRKARGDLQPGNLVQARWRARLAEHLGSFTCEPTRAVAAPLLGDPLRLAGLSAALALAEAALPEREPHGRLFDETHGLLKAIGGGPWLGVYVRWELALLAELGYGLALDRCAATGAREDLAYVSPRTGRAVSRAAGAPWRDRLLALPPFLAGGGGATDEPSPADLLAGLTLSGHFLERLVFTGRGHRLPAARTRFIDRLRRSATISSSEQA